MRSPLAWLVGPNRSLLPCHSKPCPILAEASPSWWQKTSFATTTHHAQTAGEVASMHENGSQAPRLFGTGGSDMGTSALHRATRHSAEARRRHHRLDQRDGEGQSAVGS